MSAPAARLRARAVLIDLDGTLLDTVADLAAGVNGMLADLGREPIPEAQVARYVGKGAEVLVHRALGGGLDARVDDALHARGHAAFLVRYAEANGRSARVYDGVREGLAEMRARGLRLACVTNKPQAFADPLLERCGLREAFALVIGGDALPRRKPDPLPLLHAAASLGARPDETVAIGDSLNDALAARAAGMAVLAVPYGYNEGGDVGALDVDGIVGSLLEAARLIDPIA
ncbi:MAG TPA: phosphoglycolate phosphatase [Burkholderiaceae bacterium]|nr:phosphoglycolate phosphatase [Burkholderiaceae bacterium]